MLITYLKILINCQFFGYFFDLFITFSVDVFTIYYKNIKINKFSQKIQYFIKCFRTKILFF